MSIGGFSADGSHVWLRVNQIDALGKETYSIWLAPAVGGAPRPFLERAVHAAWSPDGEKIVYYEFTPGDPTFVSDRNGANPRQIFRGKPGVHCHHHVWSPDGRYIYFVRGFPPNELDVWRIRPDGGEPERMTRHNSKVGHPALLDNRTLIYSATAEDGSGFWLWDRICDPPSVKAMLKEAEVDNADVVAEDGRHPLNSPDDWWAIVLGSGYRGTIEQLDTETRERVRQANLASVQNAQIRVVETNVVYAVARKE